MIIHDPEDEDYCLVDGRQVRRWHKVARDAGLVEPIPDAAYEKFINAKHRGRQVHEAIEFFLKGQPFNLEDIDHESLPYLQAFVEYRTTATEPVLQVEQPLYNAELDYCTTPDFCTVTCAYEVKTASQRSPLWALQVSAQVLARGTGDGCVLWLRPKLKTRKFELLMFAESYFDVVREACRGEYDGPAITAWKALR
jgi:hypothetical protein